MINRRNMLQGMAAGVGAAVGASMLPNQASAASSARGGPKRIIFFMQNQGFDPATCIPKGMTSNSSLAKAKLPEPIQATVVRLFCEYYYGVGWLFLSFCI